MAETALQNSLDKRNAFRYFLLFLLKNYLKKVTYCISMKAKVNERSGPCASRKEHFACCVFSAR